MARQVTGTTSNCLNVLTGEAIPYPLTISCRFKTPVQQVNCTPIFYGETYPSWDGDYVSISSTSIGASTGKGGNFFGAGLTVSLVPNQWYLVVCVFASAVSRTIYLNNSTQTASNTSDTGPPLNTNKNFSVGALLTAPPPGGIYPTAGFDGEIADVAIWNTALTAADVDVLAVGRPSNVKVLNLKGWWKLGSDGSLANSAGTYPAMTVYGTCPVTADPVLPPGDPLGVPSDYTGPNTDLAWVNKATHIWAVHPTNPLKADKGGLTLQNVTTGAGAAPTAQSDNTMELHGGSEANGSWYRTLGSFIWGDDPLVAGNATPPLVGSVSCWVQVYDYGNYRIILGGQSFSHTGMIAVQSSGFPFGSAGSGTVSYQLIPVPINGWIHLTLSNDAASQRLYVNGVLVMAQANTSLVGIDEQFNIGWANWGPGLNNPLNGRIRLVAAVQGATWTDAEILEQYERPYAYYKGDPTSVPDTYAPNTDLAWVQRATHIWALHPSNPLRDDIGVAALQLAGAGTTPPVALPSPENTMEFNGAHLSVARWYETVAPMIFGGVAGVSAVGAISFWIRLYGYTNYTMICGGYTFGSEPLVLMTAGGLLLQYIGSSPCYDGVGGKPLNTWLHIAVTSESSPARQRLYINGVLNAEVAAGTSGMANEPFRIAAAYFNGSDYLVNGRMRQVAMVQGDVWTAAEILEQYQRPYAYYAPTPDLVGIHVEPGAFALAGQPATLRANRILRADPGTFIEAGQPAVLRAGRKLIAEAGAYDLAGQLAILRLVRKLVGGTGVFALDGQPVDVRTTRILRAGGGEFLISGQDALLRHWMPVRGSGRIYYIAKDDRIVYIPGDTIITEIP